LYRRMFGLPNVLTRWTFCPSRLFSSRTFCPTDVMSPAVMPLGVLSPEDLSSRTSCLRTFCLDTDIISLSSIDGIVYRRLHTLPTVIIWLGCPRFGCLAWSFWSHAHTYTHPLLQVIITCMVK
jgi:hypothetical protein